MLEIPRSQIRCPRVHIQYTSILLHLAPTVEVMVIKTMTGVTPHCVHRSCFAQSGAVDILQLCFFTKSRTFIIRPNDAGISNAYLGTKNDMRSLVQSLAELRPVEKPLTAAQLSGSWELVYATVELFRASPFFQMVMATCRHCTERLCTCLMPGVESSRGAMDSISKMELPSEVSGC